MAAGGKGWAERVRRGVRTAWFMVVMMASLLVASAPALVAAGDVAVALWLEVRLGCFRGDGGLRGHLQRYRFRNSLADIPLVSVVRSVVITCKPPPAACSLLIDASKRANDLKPSPVRLSWISFSASTSPLL